MKITLDIDDCLLHEAGNRATREGVPLSRVIEKALQSYLLSQQGEVAPFRFEPLSKKGFPVPGVNWGSRDSIYERMEHPRD